MSSKTKRLNALIAAGGTGGHLFPALAVAEQLDVILDGNFRAEFVGNPNKIESTTVPKAGYNFTPITVTGFKGLFSLDTLSLPFKIYKSMSICRKIIKQKNIDIVICTGAYISYPAGIAAEKESIPLVLMESNLTPGKAIKMLSSKAELIITAFDGSEEYYPQSIRSRIKPLGNPVRKSILDLPDREESIDKFNLEQNKKTILIFGGSLGAKSINSAAEVLIDKMNPDEYQFIWQTGKNFDRVINQGKNLWTSEFIEDMASAYSAADIVISRSGATTISELCVAGKPSILVPYPSATNNEQELNAQYLTKNNAAILVYEDVLQEKIIEIITELFKHDNTLKEMSESARSLAKPKASLNVANEIIALIDNI